MIENLNDAVSFFVLIFINLSALKLMIAAFTGDIDNNTSTKKSILYDYPDNEDE